MPVLKLLPTRTTASHILMVEEARLLIAILASVDSIIPTAQTQMLMANNIPMTVNAGTILVGSWDNMRMLN